MIKFIAKDTLMDSSDCPWSGPNKQKKQDTRVTRSQHDPDNWMFCPATNISPPISPSPLRHNIQQDDSLVFKESFSERTILTPKLPFKKNSRIDKKLSSTPVSSLVLSLPNHKPEQQPSSIPIIARRIMYEKSSEGSIKDLEKFRSRYIRKKSSVLSCSSSSPPLPSTSPRVEEGEFHLLPETLPPVGAAHPDPHTLIQPQAGHLQNSVSILPQYIQNIIYHSQHAPPKPQHDAKLLKTLSKSILLPEDPADPTAFTVTPGLTRPPKAPWCSSKPVVKIVGTFAILMSLGIIIAVVYVNCFSNTFRPMHM